VFAGYYLKNMKYGAASDRTRYAPLFLGRMINVGRAGGARASSAAGGSIWIWLPTIALLLCLGGWVWFRFTRTSSASSRGRAIVNEAEVEDWLRQPGVMPAADNAAPLDMASSGEPSRQDG
jgi:hypothetical protein